jgi:hypothetical protein
MECSKLLSIKVFSIGWMYGQFADSFSLKIELHLSW